MSESNATPLDNENLSSALNQIFSNPQMLSAIASMAQSLKGGASQPKASEEKKTNEKNEINETNKNETNKNGITEKKETSDAPSQQDAASFSEKLPELLNMLSSDGAGIKQSRRSELLCALKPYLSQSRNDAIDKIIRFSELSSIFKKFS